MQTPLPDDGNATGTSEVGDIIQAIAMGYGVVGGGTMIAIISSGASVAGVVATNIIVFTSAAELILVTLANEVQMTGVSTMTVSTTSARDEVVLTVDPDHAEQLTTDLVVQSTADL
ncbi:hypothetical protein GUJ93_ZPchr0012g21229 [Zizania palustris]|uniref:Pyrroline-5-carboxylate reductase catalytic N-terminal domain-containing protein n=1 Tax=Zizania palustris TaxID=103762 RepID=A0A8J5WU00_ZIZPA|nr:hypothetical protein GUJ93_ZPchr0012g21229 [Zizania palustris]